MRGRLTKSRQKPKLPVRRGVDDRHREVVLDEGLAGAHQKVVGQPSGSPRESRAGRELQAAALAGEQDDGRLGPSRSAKDESWDQARAPPQVDAPRTDV